MGGKESSKYLVNTKEDPQNSIDIKITNREAAFAY